MIYKRLPSNNNNTIKINANNFIKVLLWDDLRTASAWKLVLSKVSKDIFLNYTFEDIMPFENVYYVGAILSSVVCIGHGVMWQLSYVDMNISSKF